MNEVQGKGLIEDWGLLKLEMPFSDVAVWLCVQHKSRAVLGVVDVSR